MHYSYMAETDENGVLMQCKKDRKRKRRHMLPITHWGRLGQERWAGRAGEDFGDCRRRLDGSRTALFLRWGRAELDVIYFF
jgi:hypothetical protein